MAPPTAMRRPIAPTCGASEQLSEDRGRYNNRLKKCETMNIKSNNDETGQKEAKCNHFMVWNIQSGYSYYRCSECNYIDGQKTFFSERQRLREEIKKEFDEFTIGKAWEAEEQEWVLLHEPKELKKRLLKLLE